MAGRAFWVMLTPDPMTRFSSLFFRKRNKDTFLRFSLSEQRKARSSRSRRSRLHIREYYYAFGAVEPLTGDNFFLVLPPCNTVCMDVFLRDLSTEYPDDIVLPYCDGAAWHKFGALEIPWNIGLFHILPHTPERNPIEQTQEEIRKRGLRVDTLREEQRALPACDAPVLVTAE